RLLGIGEVPVGDLNTACVVITNFTVNKMQYGAVIIAPGKYTFVMEADVYLERHDRDLRLRIISGGNEYIQSLVAAWPFLINHLVAMNIKAIGMIFEPPKETRIEIPLRESNPNLVMPRHSLHHECGDSFPVGCA